MTVAEKLNWVRTLKTNAIKMMNFEYAAKFREIENRLTGKPTRTPTLHDTLLKAPKGLRINMNFDMSGCLADWIYLSHLKK